MTDQTTDAGTAPSPGLEALPLTEHELAALTTLAVDEAAPNTSARALGVLAIHDQPDLLRAGYTTLRARGFAVLEEDAITPRERGLVVASILNDATDWLRIVFGHDAPVGAIVLIRSELASAFIEMDRHGLFQVSPLPASVDLVRLAGALLGAAEQAPVLPPPFHASVTRLDRDGERAEQVDVLSRELWRFGADEAGPVDGWARIAGTLGYGS